MHSSAADAHQKPLTEKTIIYHTCVHTHTPESSAHTQPQTMAHILKSALSFTIVSSPMLGVFSIPDCSLEAGEVGGGFLCF